MSCNCSNNPCSCPNANCGCPPDFTIDPATIPCPGGSTCEDTNTSNCIFTNTYLQCSQVPAGTSLDLALQALDAKVCQCGSCSGSTAQQSPNLLNLSNFYVDSLNTVPGNGSVINPFQTLDLAYAKVVGSGTVSAPQYPNTTIHVAAGVGYTTSQNIYIPSITWNFEGGGIWSNGGVSVTFTGVGTYFIDSVVVADGALPFIIEGALYFYTHTGGFLKNQGSYGTGYNKLIIVTAYSITGDTPGTVPTTLPLIDHHLTTSSNVGQPISTVIKLLNTSSFLESSIQNTVNFLGGILDIDLGGGQIGYGVFGLTPGLATGNVVSYNGLANNPSTSFSLKNGVIWSANNADMIATQGYFNTIIIQDIITESYIGTPNAFLNIGSMTLAPNGLGNDFTFLLDRVYLHSQAFSGATNSIRYTGGGQHFDYLQMQNCILYLGTGFDDFTIRLGLLGSGLVPIPCYNTFGGSVNMTNLATVAGIPGSIYTVGGILHIT